MFGGEWLSPAEVAEMVGEHPVTIRRYIADGKLPSKLQRGRRWVYIGHARELREALKGRSKRDPRPIVIGGGKASK